ncbi:MAG: GMC oxidoreductase [Pseudomonadota bacterium]
MGNVTDASVEVGDLQDKSFDVCVVGSGPVGAAICHSLTQSGHKVLCIEAGSTSADAKRTALSAADLSNASNHKPVESVVSRSLGGTARLWGGRCVPFDAIDLDARAHVPHSGWPIRFQDVERYHARALSFIGCDPRSFELAGLWPEAKDYPDGIAFTRQSFADEPRLDRHWDGIAASGTLALCIETIVKQLMLDDAGSEVSGLVVAKDGQDHRINPAHRYVLACGGLENARLMLNSQRNCPGFAQGSQGALGRYYQCHFGSRMAELVLQRPSAGRAFNYRRSQSSLLQQRIGVSDGQKAERALLNTSFTVTNPRISDARHGSGVLSTMYLILKSPLGRKLVAAAIRDGQIANASGIGGHLRNVLLDLHRTAWTAGHLAVQKFWQKRRYPMIHLYSPNGRYDLVSVSEQSPNPDNRVVLSDTCDAAGMPKLAVHYGISQDDAASLVRSHEALDETLRASGFGQLDYRVPAKERIDHVFAHNETGTHQIGTTRMSETPGAGVVDRDCRVFGTQNLYVAGSSVFPTSSDANPTLAAVALALRLADHLSHAD